MLSWMSSSSPEVELGVGEARLQLGPGRLEAPLASSVSIFSLSRSASGDRPFELIVADIAMAMRGCWSNKAESGTLPPSASGTVRCRSWSMSVSTSGAGAHHHVHLLAAVAGAGHGLALAMEPQQA